MTPTPVTVHAKFVSSSYICTKNLELTYVNDQPKLRLKPIEKEMTFDQLIAREKFLKKFKEAEKELIIVCATSQKPLYHATAKASDDHIGGLRFTDIMPCEK